MNRKESDSIDQEVPPTSPQPPLLVKIFGQSSKLDVHKQVGVKLRIHLNFVDDINKEIFLDVQLSFHFVDPKAAQFITGDPGFAIVAPNESDINVPNLEILNTRSCEHREQVSGVYANRHSVRVSVVPCVYPREVAICSLSF